jgi:drug/metabolite transporter (DMT)-like permease
LTVAGRQGVRNGGTLPRVPRAVVVAYLTCALIWGTTWYAIRVCIAGYPTTASVALRFVIAAAILLPIAARRRPWPRGRAWGWLVLAGVVDATAYMLVYLGEERVSGAVAAVLYGTQPLILGLLLMATRMERVTRRHVVGAIVSLAGVAVLFLDQLDLSVRQAVGVGLIVGSVVAATSYSMIMRRHAGAIDGVVSTAVFLGVTAIVLSVAALGAGEPLPWPPPATPTVALVYLAVIGTVTAFLTFFWLLRKTSLLVTSTLVFVFPLVALATDAMLERELPLGARTLLGAAITLAGLGVSLRRPGAAGAVVDEPAPRQ